MTEIAKENGFTNNRGKFGCLFIVATIAILYGIYWIGNLWVNSLIEKKYSEIDRTIRNVLLQESKADALLPDVIIFNYNQEFKTGLGDSIRNKLAEFLAKKYLSNDSVKYSNLNIQPYSSFLIDDNRKPGYNLTKADIDRLKKHIEFLAATVDKAVEATKTEVEREIYRVSYLITFISIVFVVFGVLLPIAVNYKSFEDLKKIKKKAKDAKYKADQASKIIADNQTHLDALPKILPQVEALEKAIEDSKKQIRDEISPKAEKAGKDAQKAIDDSEKNAKLLLIFHAINKLNDITPKFLLYQKQPLEVLVKYLESIDKEFEGCKSLIGHTIITDGLSQLSIRLYELAQYDFVLKKNIDQVLKFCLLVIEKLEQGISTESYEQILSDLAKLISHLKNSYESVPNKILLNALNL